VRALARGLAVFFDPSPPSPLPSKERGGIEGDFRPDEENFNALGGQPGGGLERVDVQNCLPCVMLFTQHHPDGLVQGYSSARLAEFPKPEVTVSVFLI